MNGRRNKIIEAELQSVLDEGGNLWAIGDVHGYAQTLVTLLHSLNLQTGEIVKQRVIPIKKEMKI